MLLYENKMDVHWYFRFGVKQKLAVKVCGLKQIRDQTVYNY